MLKRLKCYRLRIGQVPAENASITPQLESRLFSLQAEIKIFAVLLVIEPFVVNRPQQFRGSYHAAEATTIYWHQYVWLPLPKPLEILPGITRNQRVMRSRALEIDSANEVLLSGR